MSPMAQSEAMDSGYAWVVFVASFCCYMIIGGTFFTNGFLLLSMLNDYHWDLTSTALIGSLFSAFTSVLGPLSGWMVCKTSNRFTIMFGGLLMVIGCVSCYFVYNVKLMTFTYALIAMVKTYLKSMDMIFIIAGITFLTASFSGMLMTIVPSPLIKKLQNEDTLIVTQKMLPILDDAETIPLNSKRHPPKEANPMLG